MAMQIKFRYKKPATGAIPVAAASASPPFGGISSSSPKFSDSSSAVYMRTYRKNIKTTSEERYAEMRKYETERVKRYRVTMSDEARKACNEKARLRVQRYRERKKMSEQMKHAVPNTPARPSTRSEEENKNKTRQKWKAAKKKYRAGLSAQKKRRIRERDARAKEQIRNQTKITQRSKSSTSVGSDQLFPSSMAKRKAISRARKIMPSSAKKYAEVISRLVQGASPKKKVCLSKIGIDPSLVNQINILDVVKTTCTSLERKPRRLFTTHLANTLNLKDSQFGLKKKVWKYLMKYSQIPRQITNVDSASTRSDAVSSAVKSAVTEHYMRPDVSMEMPNKKLIGKHSVVKYVLQKSVQHTFRSFHDEHPNVRLGASKFAALRPKHVLLQNKAQHFQCLCEYCENVDLKLKAFNSAVDFYNVKCRIADRYHAADITTCEKISKYNAISCIDRKCPKCGVDKFDDFIQPLSLVIGNNEVRWKIWGQAVYKDSKRKALLSRCGHLDDLVKEMKTDLKAFACHLFEAKWQQTQFWSLIRNPPVSSAVIVMDYAENFTCITQNEVQSAHWTKMQVTLHPMVTYYSCIDEDCQNPTPVREAIHIISEDMTHDTHAVAHFCALAVAHLKKVRGLNINRLIEFTDGCGAQYKSRTGFVDISFGSKDLNIQQVERHFFGSRHGKSPCDGEGGIVKSAATRAVKSEPDLHIDDCQSFYSFCKERLSKGDKSEGKCSHSRRFFCLVKDGEIQRDRPDRTNVATLPGTRKLHAVIGLSPYEVCTRRLSCFCENCSSGIDQISKCTSHDGVLEPWNKCKLPLTTTNHGRASTVPITNTGEVFMEPVNPVACSEIMDNTIDISVSFSESELDISVTDIIKSLSKPKDHHPSIGSFSKEHEIENDKYYGVYYENKYYVGRVIAPCSCETVEFGHFKMKFLKIDALTNMFVWPPSDDIDCIDPVWILGGPLVLHGHGPFLVDGLNVINDTYHKYKKFLQSLHEQ